MRHGRGKAEQIVRVRTFRLSAPLEESLGSAQSRIERQQALLVQITTASGAEGWGECFGPSGVLEAALIEMLGPLALGQDALQTEAIWNRLYHALLPYGRRGTILGALSGLDMALWDLRGHLLKRPLCELLGGRLRESFPCYATGLFFRERPESEIIPLLIDETAHLLERGFRGVEAQIGRSVSYDTALLKALRGAYPDAMLMADAAHAYDLAEALQIARAAVDIKLAFLEDPLSLEFPEQYRELADRVPVPLIAGEWEQTRWGYDTLLSHGGLSQVKINLGWCGGLSEAGRIRAISSTRGVNLVPVGYGTPLNQAASLHFLASDFRLPGRVESLPGMLAYPGYRDPLRSRLCPDRPEPTGGSLRVPTGPGLGVTIDLDVLNFYLDQERDVVL